MNLSLLDVWLERLSKIAGILLPVTIAIVGGMYTFVKDKNDEAVRNAQQERDQNQKTFDNTQKQYGNLAALLPLLTSEKEGQVQVGLEIYQSEASVDQAPPNLVSTIRRLSNQFPQQAKLVQLATEAGQRQQRAECKSSPDGLYIQVANETTQLALGEGLAKRLTSSEVSPPVQGVQRIDHGPRSNELRYYFSDPTNLQASDLIAKLRAAGVENISKVDLAARYLKKGCPPPSVYELWIGTSSPLK